MAQAQAPDPEAVLAILGHCRAGTPGLHPHHRRSMTMIVKMAGRRGADGISRVLARLGVATHLLPGRPKPPTPAFKVCAGCGTASGGPGNSQRVPDPGQFVAGYAPAGRHAAAEPTEATPVLLTIDAAPVWCAPCRRWFHAISCYSLHQHR